eukprot:TRINITY_DN7986_c0_g1_i3.p1 TRINITY_DN7986_c0_g1~~TRINITY_DN7986_c0_g1_i3.p1  ORF type:complete len:532 (+),score=89.92 TRINITY_DN7986_c0_g1_i3:394-1989(+)
MDVLTWSYGGTVTLRNSQSLLQLSEKLAISQLIKAFSISLRPDQDAAKENIFKQTPNCRKLLRNSFLSDITFIIEDQRIPCHKCIMALTSDHFYAMFTGSFKESQQDEITLQDISLDCFLGALEFIYTGKTDVENIPQAFALFEIAEQFCVPTLSRLCFRFLKQNVGVENCCEILTFAQLFNAPRLHELCINFIESNFSAVSKTSGFLMLEPSLLMEIIFSDNLLESKEEQVYESVITWGAFSGDVSEEQDEDTCWSSLNSSFDIDRKASCRQLLSSIRYPLMEREYLEHVVLSNEYFSEGPLRERVRKALEYISDRERQTETVNDRHIKIVEDCFIIEETVTDFSTRPRKGTNFTEFLFTNAGDEDGIIYWIATGGKTKRWSNPHKNGSVKVSCSSPVSRYTKPEMLVSRSYVTTSFAAGTKENPPWWSIDLIKYQLFCDYYSMQMDGGNAFIRNWKLQGSEDEKKWVDLKVHVEDQGISHPGAHCAWPVIGKTGPFRHFRVIMTGPASNGKYTLAICGIELYGKCDVIQ